MTSFLSEEESKELKKLTFSRNLFYWQKDYEQEFCHKIIIFPIDSILDLQFCSHELPKTPA